MQAGRRAVGFFRDLLKHTKGEWAGQPFRLLPWEDAIVRALFGTLRPDGLRRYRRSYIEIPKKNGKSSLAAGIALYLLLGEDEEGAQIFSAAADRDQANIVFTTAKKMIEANPALAEHVTVYRNAIVRPATGGSYRVLSADVPTKHGIDAHGVLFDELHAQTNRELWDVLWGATAARRQPLTVQFTTAGYDRSSICWEQHEYAEKVLAGVIDDPEYLAAIYAASHDDDWTDPEIWKKANPSLGHTVTPAFLDAECKRAQRSPAYENTFKRFHLNIWTEQISRWMPMEAWQACAAEIPDQELVGVTAFAGLDLGQSDDFSALVLVFMLPDGRVATRAKFWLPSSALENHPLRPYDVWRRQGALDVTEGNTTDQDLVEQDVLEMCRRYAVREIAYDQRFATMMALHLQGQGLVMIDQPQGFQLNEPLRRLLELVQTGKLAHGGDPVLTWMASNAVVRTGVKGEIRPAKDHASDKIDGIVALAMALSRAIRQPATEEVSSYADGHGLFTV